MTKYVDIDVAKEAVRKAECDANWDECRFDAEFIENALDFIPAADVAPVVRCENCMDGIESDDNKYIICCRFGIGMEFDDFCSRGDRKNEGNICMID